MPDQCGGELEGIAFSGEAVGMDLGEGVTDALSSWRRAGEGG